MPFPAALYMMSAKGKIRSAVLENENLGKAFFAVNNELCASESNMFVTAFTTLLDLETGKVNTLNAGHNPPLIYDGRSFDFITGKRNFVLAGLDDSVYETDEFVLKNGQLFFMYTDGVTECMNKDGAFFGTVRLKKCLENAEKEPECLIETVFKALKEFSEGVDLSDDITMLCFQYFSESDPEK